MWHMPSTCHYCVVVLDLYTGFTTTIDVCVGLRGCHLLEVADSLPFYRILTDLLLVPGFWFMAQQGHVPFVSVHVCPHIDVIAFSARNETNSNGREIKGLWAYVVFFTHIILVETGRYWTVIYVQSKSWSFWIACIHAPHTRLCLSMRDIK